MKSNMSKKEIDNGKSSAICQQMKNCCLELGLMIHSEVARKGKMGVNSILDLADVRAGLSLLYAPKDGVIALLALHYDLTEYEWNAVQCVIPMIHNQHDTIKAYASPEIGLIGYMAELTVERGVLDDQPFRQVLNDLVNMSQGISSFVCGLRDRQEGTLKKAPSEWLN